MERRLTTTIFFHGILGAVDNSFSEPRRPAGRRNCQQLLRLIPLMLASSSVAHGMAIIDRDVVLNIEQLAKSTNQPAIISTIIFLKSQSQVVPFMQYINKIPGVTTQPLHFMPAIIANIPKNRGVVYKIASHQAATQISSNKIGKEELEVSAQSILLRPSDSYPAVNNWWQAGYTGHRGVIGLIDSGVASEHPGLINKTIIVRQEPNSDYYKYQNGIRSAHGTGAACIYAGVGNAYFDQEWGMAYSASTFLVGLAGENGIGNEEEEIMLTTSTLDWMLTRAQTRPTIINYSFGNGPVSCTACTDWSGLAKIMDYVINHEKIMWIKSAGNNGISVYPNQSTMTSPADNYNGLTVANMNPTVMQNGVMLQTSDRNRHTIRYTSSRGPTLLGRRKPDIAAPGNDTRTCAPDPLTYPFNYSVSMDYHDGYRLMGGTSSAAPHVGGAVLLLQDAGITNPMAEKALLLNSADAWTDSGKPGPDDPNNRYTGGHYAIQGSEWNPTYGWGYINMQQAFNQRFNLIEDRLTINDSIKNYEVLLPVGGKVTLVHERRVGYQLDNTEWRLSHLSLEIYDATTHRLMAFDNSPIDTVHQVANCIRESNQKNCSKQTQAMHAIIRVKLLSKGLDGSESEPFAIAYG